MKRALFLLSACAGVAFTSLCLAQHAYAQSTESDLIWEVGVGLFEKTCFPSIDTVADLEKQALAAGFIPARPDVHPRIDSTYRHMVEPRVIEHSVRPGVRTYPEVAIMKAEVSGLAFFAMLTLEARDDAPFEVDCNIWHYTEAEVTPAGDVWQEFNKSDPMSKLGYAGGGVSRSNGSITENYLHLTTTGRMKQ